MILYEPLPTMIAILSDIHANLEALQVVLADVARFDVDAIYCLGDVVGYGPDPIPCLQHAMAWPVVLHGDFEDAALRDDEPTGWFSQAHYRKMILRLRSQLARHPDRDSFAEFLASQPPLFATPDTLYVHGSPRNHVHEYIFPEDIRNRRKMEAVASLFESLCFCGHAHVPGVYRHNASRDWDFITPEECGYYYPIAREKLICNVGSVGQPRDRDRRACYVLATHDMIHFRRVEYDVERTIEKIRAVDDDDTNGLRLREGR